MDSYDHLITLLVNQAEEDINAGIPFDLGPVKLRNKKFRLDLNHLLRINYLSLNT